MAQAAAVAQPLPASGQETDLAHPPPLRLATDTAPARAPVPRLEVAPYQAAEALALQRELGVGHVLGQILVRRGLADPAKARRFLEAADAHDPAAFEGIDRALDLIRHHIAAGGPIVVHGDYDVDGVCATAIMIRALRSLWAEEKW
jgi:single-stranded-DNA-specific exonuclease